MILTEMGYNRKPEVFRLKTDTMYQLAVEPNPVHAWVQITPFLPSLIFGHMHCSNYSQTLHNTLFTLLVTWIFLFIFSESSHKIFSFFLRSIHSLGSAALSMCMVASGGADVYYENGIYCWDIAAGDIILREAGGTTLSLTGKQGHWL